MGIAITANKNQNYFKKLMRFNVQTHNSRAVSKIIRKLLRCKAFTCKQIFWLPVLLVIKL